MHCTRKVTDNIYWVGGNDRRLALFENLFPIPRGVSYNSYLIMDEKTTLMDTVDFSISRQFIENVQYVLNGRNLDYLVINHMEPDHCANIEVLVRLYPEMKLVGNAKTVQMIKQFYEMDLEGKVIEVKEKEELSLGVHTLQFFMAPMVHWPEVMVAYEKSEKVLFSADGFGTFGALNGNIFNDEMNFDRDWLDDARRYYTNIVGKYGVQVQALLKKAATLDIEMICPLHGPVWRSDLGYFIDKYDKWSRYEPEDNSVVIVYGSMYGNTENAANVLAMSLADAGVKNIAVYDASVTHVSHLIAEAFRCSHIVVATPTYNGGIYPAMESFLLDMKALGLRNRKVGILDNGTWAPTASKQVKKILEEMKEIEILGEVSIKSTLKPAGLANVAELKDAILTSLNQ
ncbi:FprA family A-type flavoprotein [uncultured Robinsoniella sp.]|uniref:FprA family A-type flavoprotein n=1 Tax=uncultured Robinsoniella sp. TaxID=904190 RepID=UPI00374E5D22